MPQNVRVMFGKVLLSMTPREQANVLTSCAWSKATDLTDAEAAIKKEETTHAHPETNSTEDHEIVSRRSVRRPQTSPLKLRRKDLASSKLQAPSGRSIDVSAEKRERRKNRQAADIEGVQYGKSRHAVDDDDMWGLLSDTAVDASISMARTSPHSSPAEQISHSRKTSPGEDCLRFSDSKKEFSLKRPSTAQISIHSEQIGFHTNASVFQELSVGLSSPSFYGGRGQWMP